MSKSHQEIKVKLPIALLSALQPLLDERGLTVDEVVRLYLRALVTGSKRSAPLGIDDDMTFGKFAGENMSVVIRADPGYVSWLLANSQSFKLAPDALALLESVS